MSNTAKSKRLILLLSIVIALSTAAYWLTTATPDQDSSQGLDALTNVDSAVLQQRINSQLFGQAITEPPGIGAEIHSTTDTSAMQAKLAGLTKNVTTQQLPSADELAVFYKLNRERYRNPSKFWLEVISYTTAKHGGRVFEKAKQGLDTGQTPGGDRRDHHAAISTIELENIYGQSFVDSLMEIEQNGVKSKTEGAALPCWHGPISSSQGAHLACIQRVTWGDYPPLEEVENQLINDWRFSISQDAFD
ncbi:peptidylprolyl isomerase [Porticoccaceae bacterium]|nr:peptidylprolyl isomerase [Porticoccaceae bacterium]MDB9970331.1 peptidylprolyl isomerase [Porticoccaceae bacterium]